MTKSDIESDGGEVEQIDSMGMASLELRSYFSDFVQNKLALFGLIIIITLLIVAIFAPVVAPYGPLEQNYSETLSSPSMSHPFGTDSLGRDIFSRVIFGYRIIFMITVIGVAIAFTIGTSLGMLAGYKGGILDDMIMRGVDILMSFPYLILALALVSAVGSSRWTIAGVLGVTYSPIFARVARSESTSIREEEFIKGLRVRGVSDMRILFRHIIPNIMGPLIVTATLQLAFGILTTSTLSFLGVGIQPPTPSLGLMLSEGTDFLGQAWWMSTFPGIAIILPVLGFNTIGDGLRDSFDPKQQGR